MKICLCINGRPHEGGMTSIVNTTADALRELGHSVDIITIFGASTHRSVKTSLTKSVDETLKNRPFLSLIIYFISKIILGFHIYWNFILKRYDAILAMDMSVANVCYPLKKLLKIPILNFPLGATGELIDQGKMKEDSWAYKYIQREEKKALEKSDINVCSAFHLVHARQVNAKPAPFSFLHCAPMDNKLFYKEDGLAKAATRKRMGITEDKFILLFLGRLAPRKGPQYLLSAFEKITEKNKNGDFVLFYVGTGPEEITLKERVEKSGLKNSVKFFGSIPHKDVADFYKIADCFMFTSFVKNGIMEPFSNSVIEAMACGLPIIAFDTTAYLPSLYKSVLRNNENCLLVPEKDIAALAKTIELLYNDKSLRQKLSEGGLREIEQDEYYAQHFAKNIEKIIYQLKNPDKIQK